jgi:hypothetical protein
LACDLEKASEEFQQIIDNKIDNLKYFQQLNATYQASKKGRWDKVTTLVTDMLSPIIGDNIDEFLGNEIDFDNLKKMIQVIALVKPEAFAAALKREINNLENFFQSELETILALKDYLDEALEKLNNEWTNLQQEDLKKQQQLELNQLMNSDVPEVGKKINEVKRQLAVIEAEVYNDNTTEELTHSSVNELITTLNEAKDILSPSDGSSIILNLLELKKLWQEINILFNKLRTPSSKEYISLKEAFKNIGENFRESVENMLGTLSVIRDALMDLDTLDTMMEHNWIQSVEPIIRNTENYSGSSQLKFAIDNYIETKTTQSVDVDYPIITTLITSNTFSKWENAANFQKLNKNTWINLIDSIIDQLESITENGEAVLLEYDDIYAPLTDDVIDAYIEFSAPYWGELFRRFNQVYQIIQTMIEGGEVTKDLYTSINELKTTINTIQSIVQGRIDYFLTNDPGSALELALDITDTATTTISGLTLMADYLGLDHMSELIHNSNFGKILDLDEKNADSTTQIMNDLSCLEEANDITKSIGIEIRKMIIAEKERKERLRNDTTQIIEQSIENETERIKELQNLNNNFINNI